MSDRLYSHVLVPTDFKPHRRAAYRVALAAAHGTGASVTLLHVAPMPVRETAEEFQGLDAIALMHHAARGWSGWGETAEVIAAENAELEGRLRAEIPPHDAGAVRVRYAVRRGEVAAEVARFVREGKVDLVVVGDNPPGLLPSFGRKLADQLLREVPVQVVRVAPPAGTREPAAV
jgi:nucleotide-binding universal stress UspA family protein